MILVTAVFVQSVAIRAVAKRRAFIYDGLLQNANRRVRQFLNLPS